MKSYILFGAVAMVATCMDALVIPHDSLRSGHRHSLLKRAGPHQHHPSTPPVHPQHQPGLPPHGQYPSAPPLHPQHQPGLPPPGQYPSAPPHSAQAPVPVGGPAPGPAPVPVQMPVKCQFKCQFKYQFQMPVQPNIVIDTKKSTLDMVKEATINAGAVRIIGIRTVGDKHTEESGGEARIRIPDESDSDSKDKNPKESDSDSEDKNTDESDSDSDETSGDGADPPKKKKDMATTATTATTSSTGTACYNTRW
ncbi:hypothetical protein BASA83_011850 [Batrachochytrium salamandrivorans]|nr:hypothetical protein BASA83_011850 [Batrachochytrium salamandrivorans]